MKACASCLRLASGSLRVYVCVRLASLTDAAFRKRDGSFCKEKNLLAEAETSR